MTKIFVDTSTWWHWFEWKKDKNSLSSDLHQQCARHFDKIYQMVLAQPQEFRFLYNSRIYGKAYCELPCKFWDEFEKIISLNIMEQAKLWGQRGDRMNLWDGGWRIGDPMAPLDKVLPVDHEEKLERAYTLEAKFQFQLTKQSLSKLKNEGVPEGVLSKLQSFSQKPKGEPQTITGEEVFIHKLKEVLGEKLADQYQQIILHCAFFPSRERRRECDLEHLKSALSVDAQFFLTDDKKLRKNLKKAEEKFPEESLIKKAITICMNPIEGCSKLNL